MNEYVKILRNATLFSGITEDEITKMLVCLKATQKEFKKDAFIFRTGDAAQQIAIVLDGRAFILQDDFWGNSNIIDIVLQGQIFAESFACAPGSLMTVSVVAETDCKVLFFDINRVLTVCSSACAYHSRVIRNLLSVMAAKNLIYNEKLLFLTQRTTRAKLLAYFTVMAQKNNSFEFTVPFSRQQLADYLSVERSGLSMELSKMKKEGLIDYNKNYFWLRQKG